MPSLYPVFEPSLPDAENFDGKIMSEDLEELDRIAISLDLAALSSLIDARTMALEILEEDQLPDNCPPVRWYLAQEGLTIVQGLLMHIEQSLGDKLAVMIDLRNLQQLLEEAKNRGVKFYLLIDI